MWLKYIENAKKIRAIYGDKTPALNKVRIQSIKVVTGADMNCEIIADINQMPDPLPLKWKEFNTIQIGFTLLQTEIKLFDMGGDDVWADILFEAGNEDRISVSIIFQSGNRVKAVCKWITINSVGAYARLVQ